jgi:hypothetical protein
MNFLATHRTKQFRPLKFQGATLAEFAVVLPVFLLITLGIIQMALVFHAKNTLNHATFMAARAAAVSGMNQTAISNSLAKGMLPLLVTERDVIGVQHALTKARFEVGNFARIAILNPTREAFLDFGTPSFNGVLQLPFERLHVRSVDVGVNSGVNVQDANLLKLQVIYGYPLKIPFAGPAIALAASWYTKDTTATNFLSRGRLPILSTSVVRMQSFARNNSWVLSRAEVANRLSDSQAPAPPSDSGPSWNSGPNGRWAQSN